MTIMSDYCKLACNGCTKIQDFCVHNCKIIEFFNAFKIALNLNVTFFTTKVPELIFHPPRPLEKSGSNIIYDNQGYHTGYS